MKSKVAIINVYLGKLPEWFQLWLNSCGYNKDWNWIIITDDTREYNYPKNVKRVFMDLDEIKSRIDSKLGIKNSVNNPYKLCDFKVVYGKIFDDLLTSFSHWGYCDLDMIFGDLSKFISDEILESNDRILNKGHLTIYKNNEKVNNYYKLPYSGVNYKKILESKYHYGFDEMAGMDKIFKENNLIEYKPLKTVIADINFKHYKLTLLNDYNYENQIFMWSKGKILRKYKIDNKEKIDEYAYIHLQKRRLDYKNDLGDRFYIEETRFSKGCCTQRKSKIKEFSFQLRYKKIFLFQKLFRAIHWKLIV